MSNPLQTTATAMTRPATGQRVIDRLDLPGTLDLEQARCAQSDQPPEAWYPESTAATACLPAQQVCATCTQWQGCLGMALLAEGGIGPGSRHGIWGGHTPAQRAGLARGALRGSQTGVRHPGVLAERSRGARAQ